jgi:hypothetical protein
MGMYIDWSDVSNRYPNMPQKADAKEGNNFYVLGAEAEVNAAASAFYAVPFIPGSVNAPDLIRDVAIDLTYYKAAGWQNEKLGPIMRKDIDRRLQGLKDGTLPLVGSGGILLVQAAGFAYSTTQEFGNPRSSFGMDAPENWSVSQDWQDGFDERRSGDPSGDPTWPKV